MRLRAAILLPALLAPAVLLPAVSAPAAVDFRFAPPEWQTAICLPDDPHKSLVDRGGELLYHYGQGGAIRHECTVPPRSKRRVALVLCEGWWKEPGRRIQILRAEGTEPRTVDTVADIGQNVAAAFWFDARDVDGDGRLWINVEAAPQASDQNTILNGLWVFPPDTEPDSQALLEGELNLVALARANATTPGGPLRDDVMLVRVTNTGTTARTVRPRLVVDTRLPFAFEPETQRVRVNDHETISASLRITGVTEAKPPRKVLQLESITVAEGASVTFCVRYGGGGSRATESVTFEQAMASRARAVTYWEQAPLPYGRVQVPDPNLQALLDGAVRNIWQAREIKQGLPAFQVGPTCYRGLWIVDGAFLLEAAQWLGKADTASRWQREYDDFMAAFRRAAQRDLKTDPQGHPYLPIGMDGQDLPQRGQWAFCQAVYPGQIFAPDDPLVAGTLAMLETTEREGMVYGTGWDATGLWNYFASFYGHAWLWQGHGEKAARSLIAMANHAAPTLVWREEQSLRGEPFRKVGDMPHNWASAEFIRLAVHLLALDRGRELHLFEGLPTDWVTPGAVMRLERVATSCV